MIDLQHIINELGQSLPLLKELENTPQDSEWHAEGNVAIHTQMVMDAAQEEASNSDHNTDLLYAAAFHDIAKPITTFEREFDGKMRIISPRHAAIGRSYLTTHLLSESSLNFDKNMILALVGHHHDVRKLVMDNSPRAKYARLSRLCPLPQLYHLCRSDMIGRINHEQEHQLEQIELFKMQAQEYECWEQNPYSGWDSALRDNFPKRSELFHQHALAASISDYENGIIQSLYEAIPRAWNIPESTYTTTLLCGPSGSGKSTWIDENRTDETVISLDQLRKQITGKRETQTKNGQVMQAAKEALKEALRNKKNIIWDATNTREDGRKWVLDLAKNYGAYTRIITLPTSVKTLISRNQKREHPIPIKALMNQIKRTEWPFMDEAHEVINYNNPTT